jgi:hypothetical protein
VLNGSGTAALTLEGINGSGPITVTLWTNGTFSGAPVSMGPVTTRLEAVATVAIDPRVTPHTPDVGVGVGFSVNGSGAAGYSYTARFSPGLGLPSVLAACHQAPAGGGEVDLSCATTVTYAQAGEARPSVALTNGYSTGTADYPSLSVAPGLELVALPDPLTLYGGAAGAVTVRVVPGSGSAPFGPVCLDPGDGGNSTCNFLGGDNWTFAVQYARPGLYIARASVFDSSSVNRSADVVVAVYARPLLSPLHEAQASVAAGTPLTIVAPLSGGAAPITYWWNDSLPRGTVRSGTTEILGPLNLSYDTDLPGLHTLTLTVEDALGTVVASAISVEVTDGPAAGVSLTAAAGGPPTAGVPYPVSARALDALGRPVETFDAAVEIALAPGGPAGASVAVNFTGSALLLTTAQSSGLLPVGAWVGGFLNFTVSTTTAGNLSLALAAAVPVNGASPGVLGLSFQANAHQARLLGPTVVLAGASVNETRYAIADVYGNPIGSGYVIVQSVFGGISSEVDAPVLRQGATGYVWVNYSAPAGVPGTVYVLSEYGQPLLAPITVPGAAPSNVPLLLALSSAGIAVAVVTVILVRRRRRRSESASASPDPGEPELRRLAEGRALLLSTASRSTPRSSEELAEACGSLHPSPAELDDWIGSLVADGSLRPSGTDERSYLLGEPEPAAEEPPRVELDPEALDRVLEAARVEDGGGDRIAGRGDPLPEPPR